jgi:general secretion pathway protein J
MTGDRRGFTLIELLLAVALMAIVLSALYSSFFVTHKAVRASEGTLLKLREARTALDVIRREVEAAFTAGEKEPLIVRDRDFYGKKSSGLAFMTHSSSIPGPARIEYLVEDREKRLVLIKRISPLWADIEEGMEADMLEEVASFKAEASTDGKNWELTWKKDSLPRLIRLTIEVPLNERSVFLSLTARVRKGSKV